MNCHRFNLTVNQVKYEHTQSQRSGWWLGCFAVNSWLSCSMLPVNHNWSGEFTTTRRSQKLEWPKVKRQKHVERTTVTDSMEPIKLKMHQNEGQNARCNCKVNQFEILSQRKCSH